MNRAERRKFNRKNKTNFTKEQMDAIEFYSKMRSGEIQINSMAQFKDLPFVKIDHEVVAPNGTEVKIRYDDIVSRKDIKNDKYIDFVTQNKDSILHISRDNGASGSLVTLEEDPDKIWLFDIYTDLLFQTKDGNWEVL